MTFLVPILAASLNGIPSVNHGVWTIRSLPSAFKYPFDEGITYPTQSTSRVWKLISLSKEHKQTIYDNIDYLYEKEGH